MPAPSAAAPDRPRKRKLLTRCALFVALVIAAALLHPRLRQAVLGEVRARLSRHTVASRLAGLQPRVERLWLERCAREHVPFPPARLIILALKRERELRIYAETDEHAALLATYPITAASGTIGPKL